MELQEHQAPQLMEIAAGCSAHMLLHRVLAIVYLTKVVSNIWLNDSGVYNFCTDTLCHNKKINALKRVVDAVANFYQAFLIT
jgi:hypothetical protein